MAGYELFSVEVEAGVALVDESPEDFESPDDLESLEAESDFFEGPALELVFA